MGRRLLDGAGPVRWAAKRDQCFEPFTLVSVGGLADDTASGTMAGGTMAGGIEAGGRTR